MGRDTKNFRQTGKAMKADIAVKNFSKMNRQGAYSNTNINKLNKEEAK